MNYTKILPPKLAFLTLVCVFLAIPPALTVGCRTQQAQSIAYNSIYSVEKTVTAAFDGYIDSVIHQQSSTNGVRTVSKAFDTFQGAVRVAIDAARGDTNAPAPLNLVTEGNDVINLISTLK